VSKNFKFLQTDYPQLPIRTNWQLRLLRFSKPEEKQFQKFEISPNALSATANSYELAVAIVAFFKTRRKTIPN
jgi:hypothetical protein